MHPSEVVVHEVECPVFKLTHYPSARPLDAVCSCAMSTFFDARLELGRFLKRGEGALEILRPFRRQAKDAPGPRVPRPACDHLFGNCEGAGRVLRVEPGRGLRQARWRRRRRLCGQ